MWTAENQPLAKPKGYIRVFKVRRSALAKLYRVTRKTISTHGFGTLELLDRFVRSRASCIAVNRAVKLKAPFGDPVLNAQWAGRYPVWTAFRCCQEDCLAVLLYEGFCDQHGGPPAPPLRIQSTGVEVLLGRRRYVPYGLVAAGGLRTERVKYLDGNSWNCRPANLQLLQTLG